MPRAEPDSEVVAAFVAAMDDDLDTPKATALLFDTVRRANAALDGGDPAAAALAAAALLVAETFGLDLGVTAEVPDDVLERGRGARRCPRRQGFRGSGCRFAVRSRTMGWTVETGKAGTTSAVRRPPLPSYACRP